MSGPGDLSRYSDSPWRERSGDRIPVDARFAAPVQTGPGAHHASYTMGTGPGAHHASYKMGTGPGAHHASYTLGTGPGVHHASYKMGTGPGAHHASYTMGTGSFKGVERPGRGVDHPPALASRLKKENSHTFTPLLGLRRLF